VGGPRSGRSTALRTLALAAAAAPPDPPLHVYVIDGAGALAGLRGLPNIEAVLAVHDLERAERLLRRLGGEISTRQGSGPQTFGVSADVVLLIDGWEALVATWNEVDHGRMLDQLISLLRDGPAVGVQAAISGGRSLLTGTVSSLLAERVVLRFADPADAMLAGVAAARLGDPQPPGRGLWLTPDRPEPAQIQVAVVDPADEMAAHHAGSEQYGGSEQHGDADRSERPGWRIRELLPRLEYQQMLTWPEPAMAAKSPALGRRVVPIGIGGDDAAVFSLDLDAGPVTLLIGPPGSGRSSALSCIQAGLSRQGEPVLRVSLTGGNRSVDEISALLRKHPDATVLVDDVPSADRRADGSAAETVGEMLAAHARSAPSPSTAAQIRSGRLVIACTATEVLTAFHGLLTVARNCRSGLLLGRSAPGDGEVFGLRLGARPAGPPGRALLVQGGQVSTVQLALPPPVLPPAER
jgi:S-DNA-T family DNA segregation ATPase FtsK/SpoIIIE